MSLKKYQIWTTALLIYEFENHLKKMGFRAWRKIFRARATLKLIVKDIEAPHGRYSQWRERERERERENFLPLCSSDRAS
jgi:hypothetical protein